MLSPGGEDILQVGVGLADHGGGRGEINWDTCKLKTLPEGLNIIGFNFSGQRFWKIRQRVEEEREVRNQLLLSESNRLKAVETFYLEQPLDHFNALSKVSLVISRVLNMLYNFCNMLKKIYKMLT